MSNPSKRKGDEFEWALVTLGENPEGDLVEAGLTVERTKAGYEREEGDILVLTPDRQRLATLQAKNRRERKWSEWLGDTERQRGTARARFAALIVKRNGIGDVGRSYAITTVRAHLSLLATLHQAETRARLAEEQLAALREQGVRVPTMRDQSGRCTRFVCGHIPWAHGDQSGHPGPADPCHADGCECPGYVDPATDHPVPRIRPFGPQRAVGAQQ